MTLKPLPRCPVDVTLTLIDDRWKVQIIRELLYGTKRFGEIRKSLGNVSTKVLTANLRSMEDSGLLTRHVYPEVPPKVEYTLTELGYSLKPILFAMVEWGSNYKSMVEGQRPIRTTSGIVMMIMKADQSDFQEITELQNLTASCDDTILILQKNANSFFLKVIDEEDKIVGAIGGYPNDDTLQITLLVVHPDYQNQGIETKLIEEVEGEYPSHCFQFCVNDGMKNIVDFLEYFGYEKSNRQVDCTVYEKIM